MTLKLTPPAPNLARLRLLAASGASGVSKRAQAELQRITTEALRRSVGQ